MTQITKKFNRVTRTLLGITLVSVLAGCGFTTPAVEPVSQRNSTLTLGAVQQVLVKGQTTKSTVLEAFGAPNVTTRDSGGQEVWTYQRSAQAAQQGSSSSFTNFILTGKSSSSSGFQNSSRTITLIVKFDSDDVVSDFSSRTSDF